MTSRTPTPLRAAALLLLPLALAACSSDKDPAAGSAPAATTTTTASAAPATPGTTAVPAGSSARLLTGDKLRAVLLRGDVLPKGYKANADGTRDTGTELAPVAQDGAAGACGELEQTAWVRITGIESASFAQGDFLNAKREEFSQEVDTYRGSGSRTVLTRIQQAFTRCAHFTDSDSGAPVKVKVKSGPIAGTNGQSVKAVITSDEWEGGTTLVATRVGNSVITTFYAVQSADLGAADVALTKRIAKNLTTAQR